MCVTVMCSSACVSECALKERGVLRGREGGGKGREGGGKGGGGKYALSGLSPAVVHCSGLPAWRLAQLGLVDSMPPQ